MRAPALAPGQLAVAEGPWIGGARECRVLFPREDGSYVVHLGEGYAVVPEGALRAEPAPRAEDRSRIRVAFFGNGPFALPALRMLLGRGYSVQAAVTAPDRRAGRGLAVRCTAVKELALSRSVPVLQPERLDGPNFLGALRSMRLDVGVVADFRRIPAAAFGVPSLGMVNLHSSLLPERRGASAVFSAIADGAEAAGATVFRISDSLDAGDVLQSLMVGIRPSDDAGSLSRRLAEVGAELVDDSLLMLAAGAGGVPQSELECPFALPSYCPRLSSGDFRPMWELPAENAARRIRALSPDRGWRVSFRPLSPTGAPSASARILGGHATLIPRGPMAPGEYAARGRELLVACGDFLYSVERLQPDGGRAMPAEAFLNGYGRRLGLGMRGFCL